MKIKIETDKNSGFCPGVIRAITTAEKRLKERGKLYSLGNIVHNSSELERLTRKGLQVIKKEQLPSLEGATVLIRAHGEPLDTYSIAYKYNVKLIDCTCPVVLQLQKKIAATTGQIIIFGKRGHAEINGLVSRAAGRALVIEQLSDIEMLDRSIFSKPITLFSQTTKDPIEFEAVGERLKEKMASPDLLTIHNTICKSVSERHFRLSRFAREHSVIIFISGKQSSNGHILYELCKKENRRSYLISSLGEIRRKWFEAEDFIGICGATSTPRWQIEACDEFLKIFLNNYICRIILKIKNKIYGNYRRF